MSFAKAITWGFVVAFALPSFVHAAQLSVSAAPASVQVGSTITVTVYVNSEGTAINNAEGSLIFPRDLFDVVSVSDDVSIFSLWIQAPTYNGNTAIAFNGGLPSPGYLGAGGKVFTAVLRAKAPGSAVFALENAAVRANDGLGTNVLTRTNNGTVNVTRVSVVPTPRTQDLLAPSATLVVSSPTHSLQEKWYTAKEAKLTWQVSAGVDAVQTLLSDSDRDLPAVLYSPPISEKSLSDLEDGVWYFAIRARTASGWGPVARYTLHIDSIPPVVQDVHIAYVDESDSPIVGADAEIPTSTHLVVESMATDTLSGLAHVEFFVDSVSRGRVAYSAFKNGVYRLPVELMSGTHTVHVRFYDAAGNNTDSDKIQVEVNRHKEESNSSFLNMLRVQKGDNVLLMVVTFLIISLGVNILLWRKLRSAQRKGGTSGSLVKLQQSTKQKLSVLKKDLERQRKEFDRAHRKRDVAPADVEYVKKMRQHLTEAEEYLAEKIKQVQKE